MRLLCSWMCRAHCHRVIKLSGTLDKVAPEKELVENVHGVRGTFLDVGKKLSAKLQSPESASLPVFSADAEPTVYFVGKMLWSKGLGSLMELLKYAEESANLTVSVDMYGGGPDTDAAAAKAEKMGLDMPFHGPLDHAELADTHKVCKDDTRPHSTYGLNPCCFDPVTVILTLCFCQDFCESFDIRSALYNIC